MHWLPERPGNGLDRVFHALLNTLPTQGVTTHGLVVGSSATSRSDHVTAVADPSASLPRRLLGFRRQVQHYLTETSPDLIAVHFALYAAPALDAISKYPFVVHFHGPWAYESEAESEAAWTVRCKALLERTVYRRADRFIVLSSAFRQVLTTRYGVDEGNVRIVPGGVNATRFDTGRTRRSAREELGWPTDRPIILSVRRLVQRVGLDRLIAAIDRVRQHHSDVLLYIAGKGPMRYALAQQIRELDLTNHVELLGFVPDEDLPLAYRAANVSVVPTVAHEGFGLIVVESLAAGTPVLVTPVGGLPEIVTPLAEPLVLPDSAPATIADRLNRILAGTLPIPSSDACQHYAKTHYDWPVIARKVRTVYEGVLA